MNERIRELEKQATDIVKCGLNGTATAESFNRKKFAQLIVRECMSLADLPNNTTGQWDHLSPSEVIANYFGVES
jgi:hypothetical protein